VSDVEQEGNWQPNMRAMQNIIDDLKFCGCGTDSWVDIMKLLLERARAKQRIDEPVDASSAVGAASEYWVEFALKMIDRANLMEHGSNINYSWVTGEGDLFLEFVENWGTDTDDWPQEVFHHPSCTCGCESVPLFKKKRVVLI
jgi:hypothetical protein